MAKDGKKQPIIYEKMMKDPIAAQQALEAAAERRIQRKEECIPNAMETSVKMTESADSSTTQTVKLQKYTITPFEGHCKHQIRFWNQFTVKIDGSKIYKEV